VFVSSDQSSSGVTERDLDRRRVLYLIVCAAAPASQAGALVELAQAAQWDVWAIATPDATAFIDLDELAARTGHPVRTRYNRPGEPEGLPPADAIVVAPATLNTVSKWAAGICDTFATGLLCEALGLDIPIAALPFVSDAQARHPAFARSLRELRACEVRVPYGSEVPPRGANRRRGRVAAFPWHLALQALDDADRS